MPPRLARIAANNFNSVRYQPPPITQREALYRKLTPDPHWYEVLQREVGQINRAAINTAGVEIPGRKQYIRFIYDQAIASYPQYDSVHLRQPELAATVPIYRNKQMILDYKPSVNGFYAPDENGNMVIAINPDISVGRQTKTAIHELAHHTLGHDLDNPLSTPIKEFQAEAVARGVRERLGALSPNDQTASASYIAGNLTNLAGSGITPGALFGNHALAVAEAVNQIAPVPAQPFKQVIPGLYAQFRFPI